MGNAVSAVINVMKKACIACVLVAALAGLTAAIAPQRAYADSPTYTMSVVAGEDVPSSVAPGDTFTVSLELQNNGSSQYTMYAMSATVRYNTGMLDVASLDTNNSIDVYTKDAGDGWTDAVLNFKSPTLKGVTWDNGTPLMNITFVAREQGSTSMEIRRVNISNSTGMGSYACTCNDAVITVSTASDAAAPVEPSTSESVGTTAGVEAPEADPSTLEGVDTSDEMTDEEKAEYEATRNGELASGSSSASGDKASVDASKDGKAANGQTPMMLYVLIGALVVAVIALVAGVIVHKRRKQADDQSGQATPKE